MIHVEVAQPDGRWVQADLFTKQEVAEYVIRVYDDIRQRFLPTFDGWVRIRIEEWES